MTNIPNANSGTAFYVRLYSKTVGGTLGDQIIPAEFVLNAGAANIQALITQLSGTVVADNLLFAGAITDPTTFTASPLTLGTLGAAFTVQGSTTALTADAPSAALTFNANIGTGAGSVGGFVFAVPVTHGSDSVAQTLTNALVVKASTSPLVYLAGADAASAITPFATTVTSLGAIAVANGGNLGLMRVNGTLAAPTIILTGQILGIVSFRGALTATTLATAAQIVATSTEGWVASTAAGTKLDFRVTPNTTTTAVVALTLDQDKSATFALSVSATLFTATGGVSSFTATGVGNNAIQTTLGILTLSNGGGVALNVIAGTTSLLATTIASGSDLQLGRPYSAGVVAATGTIAIKASDGVTYNMLVHT